MNVDLTSGLLDSARYCPSPNWSERPAGMSIDLIVIHGISLPAGEFGGPWIDQLFTNSLQIDAHPSFTSLEGLRVSSHLLVRRDGAVVQYVPFHKRAWHAGASCWRGRERCNDFSIGIELEGYDDISYDAAQYRTTAAVVHALRAAYPSLLPDAIAGHNDVAPERKTDPGEAFDWVLFRSLIEPSSSPP